MPSMLFCAIRAREVGYHKMADDALDIADASETDAGQVARDHLRVEYRKWLLSKALSKDVRRQDQ